MPRAPTFGSLDALELPRAGPLEDLLAGLEVRQPSGKAELAGEEERSAA